MRAQTLLVIAAVCLGGCTPASDGPPTPGQRQGEAQVAPSNIITGKAVLASAGSSAGIVVTLSGPLSAATVTAASGVYSFSGLPSGGYAVTASAPSSVEKTQTVAVTAGPGTTEVDKLVFSPTGQVSGQVTLGDPSGNAGIIVAIAGTEAVASTDAGGNYTLSSVPVGKRKLIASHRGYGSATVSLTVAYAVTATVSPIALVPNAAAAPAGSVAGRVLLAGLTDHGGVAVTLSGPVSGAAMTASDGAFSFAALPDGNYVVTAAAPSTAERTRTAAVTVSSGTAATVADLSFSPLGSLSGNATLGGATSGNAGIVVTAVGTSALATTDDAGNYVLAGVPVGAQTVRAFTSGYTQASASGQVVTYGGTTQVPPLDLQRDAQGCPAAENSPAAVAGDGCDTLGAKQCSADGNVIACQTTLASCQVWQIPQDGGCQAEGLICTLAQCQCPSGGSDSYANGDPAVSARRASWSSLTLTGVKTPAICSYPSLDVAVARASFVAGPSGFASPARAIATGADSVGQVVFQLSSDGQLPLYLGPGVILTTDEDPEVGGGGFSDSHRYVIEADTRDAAVVVGGTSSGGGSFRGFTLRNRPDMIGGSSSLVQCTRGNEGPNTTGAARVAHVNLEAAEVVAAGSGGTLIFDGANTALIVPGADLSGVDPGPLELVVLDAANASNNGVFGVVAVDASDHMIQFANPEGLSEDAFAGRFYLRRPHAQAGITSDGCSGDFTFVSVSDAPLGFAVLGAGDLPISLSNATFLRTVDEIVDGGVLVSSGITILDDL